MDLAHFLQVKPDLVPFPAFGGIQRIAGPLGRFGLGLGAVGDKKRMGALRDITLKHLKNPPGQGSEHDHYITKRADF